MARPKKWGSDAERMAAKRGRVNEHEQASSVRIDRVNEQVERVNEQADFIPFRHQPHVPMALFNGTGRGSPRTHSDGKSYVLVSRHAGSDLGELGIVSAHDWHGRLAKRCGHGHHGWSCHTC